MSADIILGYDKDGQPINETKRGYVYTASCILCRDCRQIIRGMGGPKHGSICVPCHDAAQARKGGAA
jgi:hypothetical protein